MQIVELNSVGWGKREQTQVLKFLSTLTKRLKQKKKGNTFVPLSCFTEDTAVLILAVKVLRDIVQRLGILLHCSIFIVMITICCLFSFMKGNY